MKCEFCQKEWHVPSQGDVVHANGRDFCSHRCADDDWAERAPQTGGIPIPQGEALCPNCGDNGCAFCDQEDNGSLDPSGGH